MSIWIPPDSDFALALREPNLLVPGAKPIGQLILRLDSVFGGTFLTGVCGANGQIELLDGDYVSGGYSLLGGAITDKGHIYTNSWSASTQCARSSSVVPFSLNYPCSYVLRFKIDSSDTEISDFRYLAYSQNYINHSIYLNNAGTEIYVSGDLLSSTYTYTADIWHTVVVTNRGLGSVWYHPDGTTQTLVKEITSAATNDYVCFAGRDDTSKRALGGWLALGACLSTNLTDEQALALLRDPFGSLFKPANDTPYLFPVAGGGGVSQELTGNSSTSAVGTLGISTEANVSVTPTGVAGSYAVGTLGVTAEINASTDLSGVAATSAVGTLTAEVGGGTTVALSGVAGTATVGALTAAGQINEFVDLLGNSSTGAVGNLIVVTGLQVALSGNAATGAVGTLGVTAEINASTTLTGVGSSGAVGTLEVTVPIIASVELTGASATGAIGSLTAVGAGQVWTEISPVSTVWTEIS